MIRTLICTAALVAAMPAMAQTTSAADPSAAKNKPAPTVPADSAALPSDTDVTTGSGSVVQSAPSSAATPSSASSHHGPAATPVPPSSATPATPATPASPSASAGSTAQAATPATPATSAAAAAAGSQVAQIVEAEFPGYDADKSGQLNQSEFVAWMTALKKREIQATGKPLGDPEIAAWAQGAFASADKDQSKNVTKAELLTYLGA